MNVKNESTLFSLATTFLAGLKMVSENQFLIPGTAQVPPDLDAHHRYQHSIELDCARNLALKLGQQHYSLPKL
jgi:hypothetical protein